MKKYLLFISALLLTISVHASVRSLQEAGNEASDFFSAKSSSLRIPARQKALTHAWTAEWRTGSPAFYVFNHGEEDGFVIISADDRAYTILAYSDKGHFDSSSLPENARAWLKGYVQAIEAVAERADIAASAPAYSKTYTPVAPICRTQWGQGYPYNEQCPVERGLKSVTGCVATAAAQIMKVHNYPEKGTGSHSYTWLNRDNQLAVLSVDFENERYAWNLMLDNYRATSATVEQKAAVAKLMYHCGVACNMKYTSDESTAYYNDMMYGLINYFGYDKGIRVSYREYLLEETMVDSIAADLSQGLPVFMTAQTKKEEGHAFVCDGIDKDGLLHINWGWDGNPDAYYRISALAPSIQGIGGSAYKYAYTEYVRAYTHIQADRGGQPTYTITAERMYFDTQRLPKNAIPKLTFDTFQNQSMSKWIGDAGAVIYKEDGTVARSYLFNNQWELNPYYYYFHPWLTFNCSSLPAGEYELAPVATVINPDGLSRSILPVLFRGMGECRCHMTVTQDSIFFSAPQPVNRAITQDIFTPETVHEKAVQKVIRDGQIFIVRDDESYTLQGQKVH